MIKFFTHNLAAKIICLLIAIGLWVYVASSESKIDNFPGSILLEVRNTPENLVVVKDVNSVNLRISAERGVWQKLNSSSFTAYIDLAGLKEGIHEVPINVKANIDQVDVVEIKPAKITIRLEPVINKTIPVNIKIEGSAAEGMIAGDVKSEPAKVDISGAKFYLDKISEAVATVKLNGEQEKFEKVITLSAFDENNNLVKEVNFTPKEVLATIPIIKGGNTKTVGIVAKVTGAPQSGFWVNQVVVDPSTIVINGSSSILAKTDFIETQPINIDNISVNKTQTVKLDLPDGITLDDQSRSSVRVEVKITSNITQKEVPASISYQNIAGNLQVANIEPNSLKIILSGASDKLQSADSSNVIINIDLQNYKTAQVISQDINKNMISIPSGIVVDSFLPSSIKITLTNK